MVLPLPNLFPETKILKPMQTWQMQTAKARLADVVRCAKQDGPQDITVHGRSVAVVLSRELL
jgi:prevent-host-death family protein